MFCFSNSFSTVPRAPHFRLSCIALPESFGALPIVSGPISCFALSDSFSTVPRASALVFMFCAPELVLCRTEGVESRLHVLRFRTRFRPYRGRWVCFSRSALPELFGALPTAPGPVFIFCAHRLFFGGAEGVGSRFHVYTSELVLGILRVLGPVFMLCAPELILGGIEGAGSSFHVLHYRTHFRRYRGRRVQFSFFALPGPPEGVRSCFHILRYQTHFRRYRGRQVPFSYICAPGIVWGGTEGARSSFHILRSHNRLGWYRGRQVPFSWFALLDSISAEPRASGPVYMFCVPGLVFGGTEVVESRFHVLRSRTHFGW
jgi:hypothetical protein